VPKLPEKRLTGFENVTWRDISHWPAADYPTEQWLIALVALHRDGDQAKSELIGMLRSHFDANEWVRRAVLEVLQPLRGLPRGSRRNFPKVDHRWPQPHRRALADTLERAKLKRPHGRPTKLCLAPPPRMTPLKDCVPTVEEQLDEIYLDQLLGTVQIFSPTLGDALKIRRLRG
jgi:hypothetical protein